MSKISLEEVEATLLRRKIEPSKVHDIIKDLSQVIEELKEDKDKEPKEKWEHVIVLEDPNGKISIDDVSGWVVQQKEGEDAGTIWSRINDAVRDQNAAASKKKLILDTTGSIFQHLKSKFLKSKNIKIKTKELTRIVLTK